MTNIRSHLWGENVHMGDAGPQRISHYAIIRLLNEGPISYTYLGKDEQRKKRYVILKVFNIPLSTKAARESFLTHARQLKKLKRSNITEIQNFGIIAEPGNQQDFGYLVIEYIEESAILKQFAPGQSFAPDEIKPFLSAIADTLQYAHVSHILHGNLHPGNILLGERLRITDFSPMPQELLQPFNHLATRALLYKAPEYLRGTLTSASDQYSLAVIVYEWLCGQRPYTATGHDELLYQQEHEQIPSPRSSNSKISSNVEAVILKALSPQPADRFEHMLKFSDAYLRALMGFPLTKNIERKQVVSPVNPPAINTTHISNRKNENEITHAKKRDEGAIHPTLTGANAYEGDTAIIRTFGTVKPKVFKREDHSRLHQVVATDLSHGGILSERLDGYEERQAQIEMAILVARSLIEERHVIVEAATGTGKSLAYLLPIVRSGKVAIISTANKALQEQLFYKDILILQKPLQEGLHLANIIDKLAESLREQRPEYMEEPENSLYDKLLIRTDNLSEAIRKVFSVDQRDTYVYYVERETKPGRRGSNLEVNATPLDVNSLLRELLFNESKVICTSATLATVGPNPVDPEDRRPNFAYFLSRVGLDHTEYPDVLEHILPYTFDYENNALLYLPRHLPEPVFGPDTHNYTNKIAEEMMRLVEASRGRAFLLFSSKRMLDAVYNIFLDSLPTYLDFRLLRQGEMNRIELVREFRESEGAVLFGLKSFWEGVDIVGESLSLVVIDKMPFDPPDDPVHEARVDRMKANKENWFGNYVLPQAVLRLKQGLGRLLRTHEDRGVMAILDTRLHTKNYGKLVINALPPARRTANLKDVQRFFEADEDTPF